MNEMEKKVMNMRALKSGSYSLVLCALALALVIAVNLFVGVLPASYTKPDTSTAGLLNISEETKGILAEVDVPVTMYLIARRGGEDTTITELLERYKDLSSNITVKTVDPDTSPAFVTQYTSDSLSVNSVIVESERRHYVVDYNDIYVTSYDNLTEEDYYNYYYYGIMPTGTPYFYGETMLTTAIDYVASESIPTVYLLTNHEEDAFSSSISASFTANNVVVEELGLLGIDAVPEDATAIILNNPKTDISAYEAEMLTAYVENGGSMILITDFRYYSEEKTPNLAAISALMGMRSEDGILVETNRSNYNGSPVMLLPVLSVSGPAELLTSTSMYTLMPQAHGIVLTGEGDADAAAFLKTTTGSFVKKAGANLSTYEKEEGDVEGSFAVAAHATLGESKFVWYSTPYIVSDEMDYYVSGGNSTLFMASVNWMCEKASAVSVAAKTMQVQPLVVPAAASGLWSTVLVIALPLAILGAGFTVWFRRRRR